MVVALPDQVGVERDVRFRERGAVAAFAVVRVGMAAVAGDVRDAPVADLQEIARRRERALVVVGVQAVQARRLQVAAGQDEGQVGGEFDQEAVAQAAVEHDDAVDLPGAQHLDAVFLLALVPVAAGHDQRVARAGQVLLDAAQQQGVERTLEVLRDQADRARAAGHQRLGDAIEHEAQARGGRLHRRPLVVADVGGVVHDARRRRDRHAGGFSHHSQGHVGGFDKAHGDGIRLGSASVGRAGRGRCVS